MAVPYNPLTEAQQGSVATQPFSTFQDYAQQMGWNNPLTPGQWGVFQGFDPNQRASYMQAMDWGIPPAPTPAAPAPPPPPAPTPSNPPSAELGAYNVLAGSDPAATLLQSGKTPTQPGGSTGGLGAFETSALGPLGNIQPGGLKSNVSSYYDLFNQLDPNSVATSKYLSNFYNNLSQNPSALDQGTRNELSQSARNAQTARGNALGTSQAAEEALTTGMYGLQQRNANLGLTQNWLNSGQTPWGQQIGAYNFGTGATNAAAGNILNYLNSGQTIESLGSQELNNLINQSTNASGGFNYAPNSTLGSPYTFVNPNAGLAGSNSANQWYNSLGAFGQQPIQPNSNAQLLGLGLGGFNSLVNSGALGGLGGIFGSAGGLAGLSGLGAGATIGGLTAIGAGGIGAGGAGAAGATGLGLGAIGTAAGLAF